MIARGKYTCCNWRTFGIVDFATLLIVLLIQTELLYFIEMYVSMLQRIKITSQKQNINFHFIFY